MKKCPPGVICIENYSMFFIIMCIFIIIYLLYRTTNKQNVVINNKPSEKIIIKSNQIKKDNGGSFFNWLPSWPYNNFVPPDDPLINPYNPPLSDERYFIPPPGIPPGAVPINVSTNIGAVDTVYRQVGILTPVKGNSKDNILPLMGSPLFVNRDMWNYYTTSNQHNNVKLPIRRNGKSCTNEYGCDKIYNGDIVYVEGANEAYKATIYDNSTIKYLPFI
jgi:hypothetical protein